MVTEFDADIALRERITEAVRAVLSSQEALFCTRVWEAWQHGTMSEEDFTQVADDDAAVAEIVAAVLDIGTDTVTPEIPLFAGTLEALAALTIRPTERANEGPSPQEHAAARLISLSTDNVLVDIRETLAAHAWAEYKAEHGYTTRCSSADTGADFWAGFERGYEAGPRIAATEVEVQAAADAICMAAEGVPLSSVRMSMRDQYVHEARAALKAAREVRP